MLIALTVLALRRLSAFILAKELATNKKIVVKLRGSALHRMMVLAVLQY